MTSLPSLTLRPGHPDFLDLPWGRPLSAWPDYTSRLEQLPRGLSRHPVVFVNYSGSVYALKEMSANLAEKEYDILRQMEDLRLPVVTPVGHVLEDARRDQPGVLITRYLDHSLPYRLLFMQNSLARYGEHLLDAIAALLVQLHLAGIFWGDCSLSNTLFRRDAGALSAYLVDAETAEYHPSGLPPTLRVHDLEIMEENVEGELVDLASSGPLPSSFPVLDSGAHIRLSYQRLWEEITGEDIIHPGERYRIQERIQALNSLGFSVKDVELRATQQGEQLRLRAVVAGRNFHHDLLYQLTGLEAEERQARTMMNEIQELRASLSQRHNRSTPLSVAAYHWLEQIYRPTMRRLEPLVDRFTTPAELYCQVLEHKWYLSEQASHDIGHQAAVEDYIRRFGEAS